MAGTTSSCDSVFGWKDEIERRIARANEAAVRAKADRMKAQKYLKDLEEDVRHAIMIEEKAKQEIDDAQAAWVAFEKKYGFVELGLEDEGEDRTNEGDAIRSITPTEQLETSPRKKARFTVDISNIKSIEVTDCGVLGANGVYECRLRSSAPIFTHFGKWKGKEHNCFSLSRSPSHDWILAVSPVDMDSSSFLYECKTNLNPFDEEWSVQSNGIRPPPKFNVMELFE